MSDAPKQTIVADGTEFDGSVNSRCAITVSGTVKGELLAPSLTVTPSGAVHGQVKVEQLKSQGEVSGEIDADDVELSGKVSDKTVISANTLEVKLTQPDGGLQVTFGNCELRVGDTANRDKSPVAVEQREKKGEPKGDPVL